MTHDPLIAAARRRRADQSARNMLTAIQIEFPPGALSLDAKDRAISLLGTACMRLATVTATDSGMAADSHFAANAAISLAEVSAHLMRGFSQETQAAVLRHMAESYGRALNLGVNVDMKPEAEA